MKVKVVYDREGDERLREAYRLLAGFFRERRESGRAGKVGGKR